MRSKIKDYINPNVNDPDEIRRRQIINVLSYGLLALSSLALIAILIFLFINPEKWQHQDNQLTVISAVIAVISAIGIYQINKRSSKLASLSLLLLLTVVSVFSDTPEQLSNGRSLFIFTLPVAVSSLILTPASSFFFAIINSIIVTVLAFQSGTVPNITAIVSFFMLALITWLSARSLDQALKDLRAINLNLDKLVEQKTQELATTLSREIVLAERNQAILDSIADGVIVFDANQVSILANPALSQIIGTPIEGLMGVSLADFLRTKDLSPANQGMIMGMIEHPEKIEPGVQVEWGKKTLAVSVARVRNSETNQTIGAVAVIRDVTREAELEKMKSTFVAVVSHELRTPLNAIIGYTEMLKEAIYGPLNEQQSSVAERIIVNTRRLLMMVGDLLDEAQMKAGKLFIKKQVFKTFSLLENMHATMDQITTDKGLYLTDEFDPNMPETITGDPQRLQQILVNLVNNSAKFTSTGGIHVRISRSGSDTSHWKLEVTDTGSGIPENEIPFIFETFRQVENTTTRQHGGSGLGLSIVKHLVELLNGEIAVKSDLNKGSTFTITLPFIVEKDI